MTKDPWLSVVVPVFNGARYLSAALDSVLSEADERTEILVSDDGSTDASLDMIARYSAQGRVVALSGPGQRNWVTNSNLAVAASRGRLVTFLHQDDLWLSGRLESIRRLAASQPGRTLWIGPTRFIDDAGRYVGTWRLPFKASVASVESDDFIEHLLVQNFIGMPAPVFPRDAFDRVGGMDETLWFTADWDLWLKLGGLAGVGICHDRLTAFRIHTHSQTMQGASAFASMRKQIDTVRSRHISRVSTASSRDAVERAGKFSCEVNVALAALASHQPVAWRSLLDAFARLGLRGSRRFLRDAGLPDRLISRLRVGLTASKK